MEETLSKHATRPKQCNYIGWKGDHISSMDFHEYASELGTPFWDFHRANLHMELLNRAKDLGATIETNSRVVDIEYEKLAHDRTIAVAILTDGRRKRADLIVGADCINSRCR